MREKRFKRFIAITLAVTLCAGAAAVFAQGDQAEPAVTPGVAAAQTLAAAKPGELGSAAISRREMDIVIYGGGLQAVAAAAKAAANAPEASVAVIVPYPTAALGGIATLGGQNYWDVQASDGLLVQGGSFAWWYQSYENGYNTEEFAAMLHETLAAYDNIELMYCTDIRRVQGSGGEIEAVLTASIHRDHDGVVQWGDERGDENLLWLRGQVFIDASEDGKLTRLAGDALETGQLLTTGRYDWPEAYLEQIERNDTGVARQQAATLMFKVEGVEPGDYEDMTFAEDSAWGGNRTMEQNPVVRAFNDRFGPQGYMLKGINMAADGEGSDQWWVNVLLVFNVDGRANERDKETGNYPKDMLAGTKNTDEAWLDTRSFIRTYADELTEALRQYDGLSNCTLVMDEDGQPVTGDILYLRETVHLVSDSSEIENGSENNYAVTAVHSLFAGDGSGLGADASSYQYRVGLGYYQTDIHPYCVDDLTDGHGEYMRVSAYARKVRLDLTLGIETPENPVYIPYGAMVTDEISNLLVAGYAAGISAVAWGELRVFPNICVLGDAAGVAAAYSLSCKTAPADMDVEDISAIREALRSRGAILDKYGTQG